MKCLCSILDFVKYISLPENVTCGPERLMFGFSSFMMPFFDIKLTAK